MSVFKPIGNAKILDKKPEKFTTKYDHVKASLDTGMTYDKLVKKMGEHTINARFKKAENFNRIKPVKLAEYLNILSPNDSIDDEEPPTSDKIMLLDIREHQEYVQCHINGAIPFPAANLHRATNEFREIPRIFSYKNAAEKFIVIYDYEDEKILEQTGDLLFEKGFDNIYALTGGLRKFVEKCPNLVFGTPPVPSASPTASTKSKRSTTSSVISSSSSKRGGTDSVNTSILSSSPSIRSSISSIVSKASSGSKASTPGSKPSWK